MSDAALGVGSDAAVELGGVFRTVGAFHRDTEARQSAQNDCLPSVKDKQAAYL